VPVRNAHHANRFSELVDGGRVATSSRSARNRSIASAWFMDGTLWVMSWLRRAAIDKVGCRSPNSEGTREFSDRLAGRGEAAELFLRRPVTNKRRPGHPGSTARLASTVEPAKWAMICSTAWSPLSSPQVISAISLRVNASSSWPASANAASVRAAASCATPQRRWISVPTR